MNKIAFLCANTDSATIKNFCGRPLIFWVLQTLEECPDVDQIVVATRSPDFQSAIQKLRFKKLRIFETDLLEPEGVQAYVLAQKISKNDVLIMTSPRSPFLISSEISVALEKFKKSKGGSLLSVSTEKASYWLASGKRVLQTPLKENGALRISTVGSFLKSKGKLTGKIIFHEILTPELEIENWTAAEAQFRVSCSKKISSAHSVALKKVKLFLTDVDGVLTDSGMYYSENGDELKRFSTHDGMALRYIQAKFGIKTGIVTTENKKLNERRSEKLKVDFLRQAINNKLEEVESICKHLGIGLHEVAFIGDDVNDEKILSRVGFAACPANAVTRIKRLSNVVCLSKSGGMGAVREWAEYLFGEVEWS